MLFQNWSCLLAHGGTTVKRNLEQKQIIAILERGKEINVSQLQMLWTDRGYIGQGETGEEESTGPPDRLFLL
jgi:hypothetical protein